MIFPFSITFLHDITFLFILINIWVMFGKFPFLAKMVDFRQLLYMKRL